MRVVMIGEQGDKVLRYETKENRIEINLKNVKYIWKNKKKKRIIIQTNNNKYVIKNN